MSQRYDVLAIGRPIVDGLATVGHGLLRRFSLDAGSAMQAPSLWRQRLQAALPELEWMPGGAVSNTAAGVRALGLESAFVGKTAQDAQGAVFRQAFADSGVHFATSADAAPDAATASCLILTSPDDRRTILFTRGVADDLRPADLETPALRSSRIVFTEANLLCAKTGFAVSDALGKARSAGAAIAITLDGINAAYERSILPHLAGADIVLGNRQEYRRVFGTEEGPSLPNRHGVAVMTDGPAGALVASHNRMHRIDAPVAAGKPDTLGGGDAFAAGFLAGRARNLSIEACGFLAADTAHAVLATRGARPSGDWTPLARRHLGSLAQEILRPVAGRNRRLDT